jgi:hypothetical protein
MNTTDISSPAIQDGDTLFFGEYSKCRDRHPSDGPTTQHAQPSDKEGVSPIDTHRHEISPKKDESVLLKD